MIHERPTVCRGVRGATTAANDTPESIVEATRDLLARLAAANGIDPADVVSVFFTASPDLTAAYPAAAARTLGWVDVPLMCAVEIAVPGGLERAVRVLVHWNTRRAQSDIRHIYVRGAERLRPDLAAREADR